MTYTTPVFVFVETDIERIQCVPLRSIWPLPVIPCLHICVVPQYVGMTISMTWVANSIHPPPRLPYHSRVFSGGNVARDGVMREGTGALGWR